MTNAIQTGLLAYGMSGQLFQAPFVAAHPAFELRAVVERSRKQAQQRYPDVISYQSVAELLADEALELVIVNTPNDSHVQLAREALQAGKHVLLEKPVATTVAEWRELCQLARAANRQLLAYQNRRWDSDFQSVRQVVASGQLGQLAEVTFRFDRHKLPLHHKLFKEEPHTPGSGLLFDLGPHVLDQALSLFGRPAHVRRTQGQFRPGSQVTDYFQLQLHYPQGPLVTVVGGLVIPEPLPSFVLHGTHGSYLKPRADVQEAQLNEAMSPLAPGYGLEPAELAGQLTVVGEDGRRQTSAVPAPKGDYMGLFEAVYQTLRHGAPYPITEEQLLWQLQAFTEPDDAWELRRAE
ncbi:Gfo/Idh/MocA family oxidoreductase [Hymenobacter sp. 15J16-1T3B]|uniref:Gfo/Idh/MocA family oxidoreductase n=1 Tax=Hymenobacter sp. 15J16-1T3B TaxID=2886941 RepID=UPI001D125C92|nr:Gfo/Idh/MocA family oxidoreductase [Hymenobacter sp. 15J16-1T3B]MCC3160463.1 Gfo/Idh/MocA family oxidoreductase [Hymenobacter sp. 15J16-1T3B]